MKAYYSRSVQASQDLVDWLYAQTSGIYAVRLVGKGHRRETIDHTITVDARRKLIFDPVEPYALSLRVGSLTACLGDEIFLHDVAEVHEIFKQVERAPGKAKRHKTTEQRKRLRENKRAKSQEQKKSHSTSNSHRGSSSKHWFSSS